MTYIPFDKVEELMGNASSNKAVTDVLCVSPNGDGSDGGSWASAYTTLQDALDAASTDADDCTLILVSPHTTYYDINTTGDPTWSGNYIIMGTHRNWAKIKNDHVGATSVMKFTGNISLVDLNIDLGTGNNGIIFTNDGWRVYNCQFIGEDLTSQATALHINGVSRIKFGRMSVCNFLGESSSTYMTGIKLTKGSCNYIKECRMNYCKTCVQTDDSDSDNNLFREVEFANSGIGVDIDAGNNQAFEKCFFVNNTTNVDDEVSDNFYKDIIGDFLVDLQPSDFSGITVTAGAGANNYGSDTELIAANAIDQPFMIVGYEVDLSAGEKYIIRLSNDSGSTFFSEFLVEGVDKAFDRVSSDVKSDRAYVFNANTRISASVKSESGSNTVDIWLEVQKI